MSIAPQSPQAYLELGKIRFAQKRFPEGVALLEQALQYDPNSIEALRLVVSYDLYVKQPDKALARLNAQIEKSPKNSSFYDLLAELQIQNKNLDQAAATVQKAMQLNSNDGEARCCTRRLKCSADRRQMPSVSGKSGWQRILTMPGPRDPGTLEESRGDMPRPRPTTGSARNPAATARRGEQSCLSDAGERRKRGCGSDPRANGSADYAEFTCHSRHIGVGLLLQGSYGLARDCWRMRSRPNQTAPQCISPGNGLQQTRDKSNAAIHLKKAVSLAPIRQPQRTQKQHSKDWVRLQTMLDGCRRGAAFAPELGLGSNTAEALRPSSKIEPVIYVQHKDNS